MKPDDKREYKNGDRWQHRSAEMLCGTCMYYLGHRCRRHAPTMQGFPAVYPDWDWCGDHKLSKQTMEKNR